VEHNISNGLELDDNSSIAVIGGGPAGSFFTYFALDFAQRVGIDINIDIYEAKDFTCAGPSGCNHCGGIVSESLIQMLSTEGIVLPANVIQKGIETYTLHLESGTTVIKTPLEEQRIAAVYRGFGPKGAHEDDQESFDNFLLQLCAKKGANIHIDKVTSLERTDDGINLSSRKGGEKKYDLVVGAAGLNPKTLSLFKGICPAYLSPETTKTHICEFYLDPKVVDEYFGNSMHVFLLDVPNIKFGALIPKGHYVTLVLLGSNINRDIVKSFLDTKEVRQCFPPDIDLEKIIPCFCFPTINIKAAKSAYSDRAILIGDSSSSKLYKNGIGSAYITAKAAAKTAIFEGISEKDFKKTYQKVCNELNLDNNIGKGIFALTTIIQKSPLLKKGLYKMVVEEQGKDSEKRRMSSILWDTFTGSAPYTDILKRGIHPLVGSTLILNTIKGTFKNNRI
jgi:flavin-dependent dehydrogenase